LPRARAGPARSAACPRPPLSETARGRCGGGDAAVPVRQLAAGAEEDRAAGETSRVRLAVHGPPLFTISPSRCCSTSAATIALTPKPPEEDVALALPDRFAKVLIPCCPRAGAGEGGAGRRAEGRREEGHRQEMTRGRRPGGEEGGPTARSPAPAEDPRPAGGGGGAPRRAGRRGTGAIASRAGGRGRGGVATADAVAAAGCAAAGRAVAGTATRHPPAAARSTWGKVDAWWGGGEGRRPEWSPAVDRDALARYASARRRSRNAEKWLKRNPISR
jgi:hypothetical protein